MCNTPYSKELIQLYKEFYLRIVKKTRQVPVNIFTTNYDLYSENALDELGIMYNNGFWEALNESLIPILITM